MSTVRRLPPEFTRAAPVEVPPPGLEREVRMVWVGKQTDALLDATRELDIEGALRASKTTICLWKELNAALDSPGIHSLLCRWTDDATHGILKPVWRSICLQAGVDLRWNGEEQYDELPLVHTDDCQDEDLIHSEVAGEGCPSCGAKSSRIYIRGLKSADQTNRYSKFRGLTLARVYCDQAEELPQDVYLELAARLSQKGHPHQIVISPNAVEPTHWIAIEFPPHNNLPSRKYMSLAVHDNAHNLPPEVIPNLERLYPPEHPKHRTMVLGKRGLNVIGVPVYKGAFMRSIHEADAEYSNQLQLEIALDFGKNHPCVVFRQVSPLGQVRFLGGILGQSMYLDDFLEVVMHYGALWFPNPDAGIKWCCDPAGATDTSHGTKGAVSILKEKRIVPTYKEDSNSPLVRLAVIERMAAHMRRRSADRAEAFVVSNSERWLRVSAEEVLIDRFLADGFEAGYVWSKHFITVGRKQLRIPLKDGWYEHGMNCAEYLELNFGLAPPQPKQKPRAEHVRRQRFARRAVGTGLSWMN